MSVAAATVVADLAGPQLVPGLRHVQHHAIVVDRLEGPGDVGRDLGEEAGIGVAVRVERLAPGADATGLALDVTGLAELSHREFPKDADTLLGVASQRKM